MRNRLVVPPGLSPKETAVLLRHIGAINEKFFGGEELNGDGYYSIPIGDPVVSKKIVEALKCLCDLVGIPAYIGRDIGCWRLGIVWE